MRPEMVENGVKFLRHPNVQSTPLSERVSFLEQKGMTKEEIQEAIERYQSDPEGTTSATPANPSGAMMHAAPPAQGAVQAISTAAPMAVAAAGSMQQAVRRARLPTYIRVLLTLSSLVGAATVLGFMWNYMLQSGYFPWFRSSRRLLEESKAKEEDEEAAKKEEALLSNLQDVSSAIQSQTAELTKLCTTIDRKEEELEAKQTASKLITSKISEQATMQAIAELKAEVSTLKALLMTKQSGEVNSSALVSGLSKTGASVVQSANESAGTVNDLKSFPSTTAFTPPVPRESAAQRMENALKKFRQENPVDQLKLASGILIMYVKNLVDNPDVPRYRRIAPANANFKQKIEPLKHHDELLKSIGFESAGLNMEWKWHLLNRSNGEFDEHLAILRALLKSLQALASAKSNDPLALEEIAHQHMEAFYEQRNEESKASTASITAPTPLVSAEQAKKETDLQAFLTRLEQKAARPAVVEKAAQVNSTGEEIAPPPSVPEEPVSVSVTQNDSPVEDLEEKAPIPEESTGPAYPKSFLEVMEMLKKGEKVPGIQEIEDRVSDESAKYLATTSTQDAATPAAPVPAKPWETRQK
ncbi:hypothetical protein Poli38472_011936 [Pythium oligandrum]|uniref:Peroxisomal membrane protein PEX14 n=1 Tax=Pythium oligandrum TaxID=41045 RepID=A0A8K1CNX9_PYTOL|nr:hypothetical protein Poli38472_011936 [Pythium oligandrum]|eukprot:TMW66820.1 hypothetical protein Poli38472_011936 [Pythium oligandrum]